MKREEIQEKAIQIGLENDRCTIVLPVRTGKSLTGLRISQNYKKVLVSYPSKSILKGWRDDIEKFGIDDSHVTFTTHRSLCKHELEAYELLIIDELHSLSAENINHVINNCPKRILGLTATPSSFGIKKRFMDTYCPVKFKLDLADTIGITNKDYQISVHLLQPNREKNLPLSGGRMWSEANKIGFFEKKYNDSKQFFDLLKVIQAIAYSPTKMSYMKKLVSEISRGLFFVETILQCEELGLPAYHTKEKNSEENLEKFKNGEIDKLVCVSQLSQGVTIQNLKEVVLLHTYSSNSKAAQRIGRCLNYSDEIARVHVIVLDGTKDRGWNQSGLEGFSQEKIKYINI